MANKPSLLLIVTLAMVTHGVSCLTVDAIPSTKPTINRLLGNWHIVEANGFAIANPPVVKFTATQVSYKYCNLHSGNYKLQGNTISFSNMLSTLRACMEMTPNESVV